MAYVQQAFHIRLNEVAGVKGYKDIQPPMELPTGKVGPAFDKLIPRRKAFVIAYVRQGKRNATKAYLEAGYSCATERSAQVNASLMLHRDDIQAAIQEYVVKEMVALVPVATNVAAEMIENAQTDPATRARLILGVWDRGGIAAKTEHRVTVEHIGQDPALLAEARRVIDQLNLTAEQVEQMFGRTVAGKVTDAEYQVVEEPDSESLALPAPEDEAEQEDVQEEEVRW